MSKLPLQPIYTDEHGRPRFRENKIVRYLLDNNGKLDLNDLARAGFPNDDWEQFAQLIGYSLSGFSELSYVSDETYEAAQVKAENAEISDETARLQYAEERLELTRQKLKELVPQLFKIHPDDLEV